MHESTHTRLRFTVSSLLAAGWVVLSLTTGPRVDELKPTYAAGVEFFENNVRPVLMKHCYSCHSHAGGKMHSGLALDSGGGWEKGGVPAPESSPASRARACSSRP